MMLGSSLQKKALFKDPRRPLLGSFPFCCITSSKKSESPPVKEQPEPEVRECEGEGVGETEGNDRRCQKSSGPAISYSKLLCRVAIFFSLSHEGIFYSALSLSLSTSPFLVVILFILFCDVPFFALVSFRRCSPFFIMPSLLNQGCLSLHHTYAFLCVFTMPQAPSFLFFISLLLSCSNPFPLASAPPPPIPLINSVSSLCCSLFPSCISSPLIKSQYSLSLLPFLLFFFFFLLLQHCFHLTVRML